MGKSPKRFVWRESEGILKESRIIVDTVTGVNYLFVHEGYAGGLTPLLDAETVIFIVSVGRLLMCLGILALSTKPQTESTTWP